MTTSPLYEEIEEFNQESDTQEVVTNPPPVTTKKKKSKKRKREASVDVAKNKIRVLKAGSFGGSVYNDFDNEIKNKVIIGYAEHESVSVNETSYTWEGKRLKGIAFQINRSYNKDGEMKTFSFKITKKKLKAFFQAVEMAKKIFFESDQF